MVESTFYHHSLDYCEATNPPEYHGCTLRLCDKKKAGTVQTVYVDSTYIHICIYTQIASCEIQWISLFMNVFMANT